MSKSGMESLHQFRSREFNLRLYRQYSAMLLRSREFNLRLYRQYSAMLLMLWMGWRV